MPAIKAVPSIFKEKKITQDTMRAVIFFVLFLRLNEVRDFGQRSPSSSIDLHNGRSAGPVHMQTNRLFVSYTALHSFTRKQNQRVAFLIQNGVHDRH